MAAWQVNVLARLPRSIALVCMTPVLLLNTACVTAPPSAYAWGGYEELIYTAQTKPGTLTPEAQIDALEKDRQAATAAQGRLPPGWHAHLASLYAEIGRPDLAQQELAAEKTAFPESTILVNRLLGNLEAHKP